MYYKPDPNEAYPSIQHITNDLWAGWLVRGMHRWGASVLHHPDVPAHGARLPLRRLQVPARAELADRRAPARVGPRSRASPATCCRGTRRRTGRRRSASTSTPPRRSSGRSSRSSCKAGRRSTRTRCRASTRSTCSLIPGAIIALITLHLYLVIRLGVTSPPWSKDAAARARSTPASGTAAARGLTAAPAEARKRDA